MFEHTTQIRVRYGETDQMGYVYHGVYAQYYEVGRVELIRVLGLTYRELEEKYGILMPVMSMEMRFVRPAHYDELLNIKTSLRKYQEETATFHVEIRNEKGQLVNGGSIKLCFIDAKTNKRVPTPDYFQERLRPYFESEHSNPSE